jgi:hypothetical protein
MSIWKWNEELTSWRIQTSQGGGTGRGDEFQKGSQKDQRGRRIIFAKATPGSRLERETVHKASAAVAVCGES